MTIRINVHHYFEQSGNNSEVILLLNQIIKQNTEMAKNFTDLEAQIDTLTSKVDGLQSSLDAEQEQIKASIDGLTSANAEQTALIQQLRDELAGLGVDQAKIDELVAKAEAVNTKLDDIKTDLEGTIADEPAPEPEV